MANCDSPFSFWSPTVSPRKPVNNTSSARIVDRTQPNSKTPFPLDRPPSYTCTSTKNSNESTTTDSNRKESCCQHAQPKPSTLRVPAGGGFKGITHKHKVILMKSLPKPGEGLVTTKYGQACHDCKRYKADKAKPIEKLIADTRKNAKISAKCESHAKEKEANYSKIKGHLKGQEKEKGSTPPADVCCMEDCVGKRVYNKASLKKKQVPTAVRLMDWPWYWSRYFPTAASRVAKRIIQAKVDAENAKLHPQPVAEFEVCFLPPPPKSVAEKTTGKTPERSPNFGPPCPYSPPSLLSCCLSFSTPTSSMCLPLSQSSTSTSPLWTSMLPSILNLATHEACIPPTCPW